MAEKSSQRRTSKLLFHRWLCSQQLISATLMSLILETLKSCCGCLRVKNPHPLESSKRWKRSILMVMGLWIGWSSSSTWCLGESTARSTLTTSCVESSITLISIETARFRYLSWPATCDKNSSFLFKTCLKNKNTRFRTSLPTWRKSVLRCY